MFSRVVVNSYLDNFETGFSNLNEKFRRDKSTSLTLETRNGVNDFFGDQFESTIDIFDPESKEDEDNNLPKEGVKFPEGGYLPTEVVTND